MPRKIARYGWTPDLPDGRDQLFAATQPILAALPPRVDLRAKFPKPYDQGQLGSCTANAIAGAVEFNQRKQKQKPTFTPSRLFIYYNERVMEGTVDSDAGAMIRDGIKSVVKQGAPPEKPWWPYDIAKFRDKPPKPVFDEAAKHQAVLYQRVACTLNQMKGCLAAGFPFVFGFSVYESFESQTVATTGVVNMPLPKEQLVGGHAVLAVGYDDSESRFLVRNSWSDKWGLKGYFTMPYTYLLDGNLADDFWTIRMVE
jgi:C1A family cysteine protease